MNTATAPARIGTVRDALRPRHVLCLPGFGDPAVGEQWVSDLDAALDGVTVDAVDWPGLWTRWAEPVSFQRLVDEAIDAAADGTVLVGHSLGGRVALWAGAVTGTPAVAICSPATIGIGAGDVGDAWRRDGVRPTVRRAPNGMAVTFELPVSFLHEVEAHLPHPRIGATPSLLIFGSNDPQTPVEGWNSIERAGDRTDTVIIERCGHRFMDDPSTRADVVTHAAAFITTQ